MSVTAADLIMYGSLHMPEDDVSLTGGVIETSTRVVFSSGQLANLFNDTVDIVSDDAIDTQYVTVFGRNTYGSLNSGSGQLNGLTPVNIATTFERILKIVSESGHNGTLSISMGAGSDVVATLESGVCTVRRPFYNVAAEAAGGANKKFYEKIFLKNNNLTNAALNVILSEVGESPALNIVAFDVASGQCDNTSVANRLTAPTFVWQSGFNSYGKDIPGGDLNPSSGIGIWLELTLNAGTSANKMLYTMSTSCSTT